VPYRELPDSVYGSSQEPSAHERGVFYRESHRQGIEIKRKVERASRKTCSRYKRKVLNVSKRRGVVYCDRCLRIAEHIGGRLGMVGKGERKWLETL